MHIGMIGGIGPAATEFYYRNLVELYKSSGSLLDLTIVHAETRELVDNIASNSPDDQAQIFLRLAQRLYDAGAEVVVISSIAGHFCFPEFEILSPLPVISIIPELDLELFSRGLNRVGLLGHRVTMESRLFGGISNSKIVIPQGKDLDMAHDEYIKMATTGKATDDQREQLFSIGRNLCTKQDAEAIVLAGTDLFLAFDGQDCGFQFIDSALIHIHAIHRKSIEFDANKKLQNNAG